VKTRDRVASGEAARILGVATATVQRWVDLGILSAERTAGGHRRISLAEVRRYIASSRPSDLPEPLHTWLECLLSGDEREIRAEMLAVRRHRLSWAQLAEELASVLAELGRRWEMGNCLIFEEHIATEALRRAAASCASDLPRSAGAPRAVLCSIPGERHQLGLSLAELVLAEAGWRVFFVGEGPPPGEMRKLLGKLQPSLVIVTGSAIISRVATRSYQDAWHAAASEHGVKLLLAGHAPWRQSTDAEFIQTFVGLSDFLNSTTFDWPLTSAIA
jgi:excisionase family DNA binding protein